MCTLTQSWVFGRNYLSHVLKKQYGSHARAHKEKQPKTGSNFAVSRLCPWKNEVQLSKSLLRDGIIYNKDGLVMVNKPYGVATLTTARKLDNDKDRNPKIYTSICNYTLSQSLPHLAKELNYDSLSIVRAPERYSSGVAILAANDIVLNRVHQSLKRSKPAKKYAESYLAITVGVPDPIEAVHRLGIILKVDDKSGLKYPELQEEWSSRAERRGEVKLVSATHRLIARSQHAGLVEIETSTARRHFLRALLARLRSPALGDAFLGASIATVMGVKLPVVPAVGATQKLSAELLDALGLKVGQENSLPTYLHLWRQTLHGFLKDGKDLTAEAPLPETFLETCNKLNLQFKLDKLECDVDVL